MLCRAVRRLQQVLLCTRDTAVAPANQNHSFRSFRVCARWASSSSSSATAAAMRVRIVPVLEDNYSYLIIDEKAKVAAAVDPAEPDRVLAAVEQEGVKLTTVLTTHHHKDHSGGNADLAARLPGLMVCGGEHDAGKIDAINRPVKDGEMLQACEAVPKTAVDELFKLASDLLSDDISVRVLFTPCHTKGHVLYHVQSSGASHPSALFTGDTMFAAGCGRFFEGDAKQMYYALVQVIGRMDPSTLLYPGHEYTVSNLLYAQELEPDNVAIQRKLREAQERRARNEPTVPTTVGEELTYNPFMRVGQATVAAAVSLSPSDPVAVMAAVRARKDTWKPRSAI